jgi:hypothetical protein
LLPFAYALPFSDATATWWCFNPQTTSSMKKFFLTLIVATVLSLGVATATAGETAPKSVIHVVTVAWKATATPEQIQAALDGVKALPAAYPDITHVWVKSIKVQNPEGTTKKRTHVFVMEFKDEQALKDYSGSAAQKEWYKLYQLARDESTTHDITN